MTDEVTNKAYAEAFVPEDELLLGAREAAAHYGCAPVSPGVGQLLQVLASAIKARNVVEIGTGTGVSGLYLLRGMHPQGVLTSIDVEPEHHREARHRFAIAGVRPERVRLITGRALDVLPRLSDAGYDLVFLDASKRELPDYVQRALALLRPGGTIVVDNALWHGRVPDPAQRDEQTVAVREALRTLREHENLTVSVVNAGDGVAIAVKSA